MIIQPGNEHALSAADAVRIFERALREAQLQGCSITIDREGVPVVLGLLEQMSKVHSLAQRWHDVAVQGEAACRHLLTECTRLHESLGRYGVHVDNCPMRDPSMPDVECSCGYTASCAPRRQVAP